MKEASYTAGQLRDLISTSPDNAEIKFSGGLTIYRAKYLDDGAVFIEFNEPEAHLDEEFKKSNPHIKVVFTK